jgi:outer membrane cobalamin receptor
VCWRAWLLILVVPYSASALPPNAGNGGPVHRLEPVVVTASREPMPAERAPGTITVITREEIERAHNPTVLDERRCVPGMHIEQH